MQIITRESRRVKAARPFAAGLTVDPVLTAVEGLLRGENVKPHVCRLMRNVYRVSFEGHAARRMEPAAAHAMACLEALDAKLEFEVMTATPADAYGIRRVLAPVETSAGRFQPTAEDRVWWSSEGDAESRENAHMAGLDRLAEMDAWYADQAECDALAVADEARGTLVGHPA